jgi:uncharacterized membrane protein YiaA
MGAADYPMQSDSVGFHRAWRSLNNNKTIFSVLITQTFVTIKKFQKAQHLSCNEITGNYYFFSQTVHLPRKPTHIN